MNILPKKSWHVRKKENIARVRRDEAEAAEKEKEIEKRAKLAEQEVRIAFLRKRAREKFCSEDLPEDDTLSQDTPSKQAGEKSSDSINFLEEAEPDTHNSGTNKEYEKEKKKEKEDYEKKIGLLTYLGQDSLEASGAKPWFEDGSAFIIKKGRYVSDDASVEEVGLKGKLKFDPLKEIIRYTDIGFNEKAKTSVVNIESSQTSIFHDANGNFLERKKLKKHKKNKKRKLSSSDNEPGAKRKKKHKKDHHNKRRPKKCKHQKHKTSKESSPASSDNECEERARKDAKLALLREERLKREAVERKRAERLLAGKDPNADEPIKTDPQAFKQKYNSQFNPQIAKQNFDKTLKAGTKYWLE